MRNILLVLSTAAQSPKATDVALELAKTQGGALHVLFVADVDMTATIFDRLEGTTMIGESQGQSVQSALLEEYKRQGAQQLAMIKARADAQEIPVETIFKMGGFADECIAAIREQEIETTVLTRARRSQLSRFIFGSPIKKIQDNVECKFEIVDLD